MDKKLVAERLRALASDDKKRSKAARLRDVIDDVEVALAAGVSRADVLAELTSLGLEMSLATFETTLKRVRKKRANTLSSIAAPLRRANGKGPQGSASTLEASAGTTECGHASHNPADLDIIISDKPDLNALARLAKRNKR
jgi:hypothetical protein